MLKPESSKRKAYLKHEPVEKSKNPECIVLQKYFRVIFFTTFDCKYQNYGIESWYLEWFTSSDLDFGKEFQDSAIKKD